MEFGMIYLIAAVFLGLYMTWGIGANDVANAMGTSVGSRAITFKQAILIAAFFEFVGAFLAGGHVTSTIRKGIIDPMPIINQPEVLIWGMLAALLAAGIWLMVASYMGWPVSTTHSIVGALVGFCIVGIGPQSVNWGKIGAIVASWIISPVIGATFAFFIMISIQRLILDSDKPLKNALRYSPFYVFLVGFLISLVTLYKGLKHLKLDLSILQTFVAAIIIGIALAIIGKIFIQRRQSQYKFDSDAKSEYTQIERIFGVLQICTACAMAFAHGSNDVANGVGPLAAINSIVMSGGEVMQRSPLPIWILILGGTGIVIGLATMGHKVMRTIGTRITELVPTRGYSAELAAAATVVVASRTGIPVSTTHIAVGAVMGVGIARGIKALNLRVIGGIFMSWVITLPVGAALSIFFFYFLRGIFM
jgi:PiT family inorganic phosphate transporter